MKLAPRLKGDTAMSLNGVPDVPVLYAAAVTHRRRAPIANHFRYRANYWLVDFDHLAPPRGIMGCLARFERSDHCDVRALLVEEGMEADRIFMLSMARTLGYVFNPISVFWCYNVAGACVAVLTEVHNTYGGRHTYVLRPDGKGRAEVDKVLYVSPFYPVDGYYAIRVSEPGPSLSVSVTLHRAGDTPFVASLRGERQNASVINVLWASLIHSSLRTSILIRWQAVQLWLRGLKVQPR